MFVPDPDLGKPAAGREPAVRNSLGSWPALDLVKFWCVLWMILLHTFFWVATEYGYVTFKAGGRPSEWMKFFMVLGFFPLMLPITAGCAFRFALSPRVRLERLRWPALLRVIIMSLFICCAGFAMNVLSIDMHILFAWNVLQLVAVSYLLIAVILTVFPIEALIPVAVAVLFFTPALRRLFGDHESYFTLAIIGRVPSGFGWPVCPWLAAVIFGFLISEAWVRKGDAPRFGTALGIAGLLLIAAPLADGNFLPALDRMQLMGGRLFNPPSSFILAVFGVTCLTFGAATWLARRVHWGPHGIVNCFSRAILWVYVVHMVVGTRMYELLGSRLNIRGALLFAGPVLGPAIAVAFPLALILLSWATGYAVIRLLGEKVIHVRLRRARA